MIKKNNYIQVCILQLLLCLLISLFFIPDFSINNFLLFLLLFTIQLKWKSVASRNITFFMYLFWVFFYFIHVHSTGDYYTETQTFTDSNYYDYHALDLSVNDIKTIILESNKTWQSTFVISFYSIVYKVFGATILSPIIINLIIIFFTFKAIRIDDVDFINNKILFLLFPFLALNLVVPGKDVLTLFLMAVFLNTYFDKNPFSKKNNFKRIIYYIISSLNRFNSVPILLIFEIKRAKKNFTNLIVFGVFSAIIVSYTLSDLLSHYLDVTKFINIQREYSSLSSSMMNILLPRNIILFILTIPIRIIVFLVAPFPNFYLFLDFPEKLNPFFWYFTMSKFLSGIVWFKVLIFLFKKRKVIDPILLIIIFAIVFFISTVHLVEGGRYRVLCDLTILWLFAMSKSNKKLKISL
jgi:hypothetical protein